MKEPRRDGGSFLTTFIITLVLLMSVLTVYIVNWYVDRARVQAKGARYQALYVTAAPTADDAPEPEADDQATPGPESAEAETEAATETAAAETEETEAPAATEAPETEAAETEAPEVGDRDAAAVGAVPEPGNVGAATPEATVPPTQNPAAEPTAEPTATPEPTTTPEPTATPTPEPTEAPLETPGPDTLIYALPTAPPVQESFKALLEVNPDTVGYLTIGDMVSLPVVQRVNSNGYYLFHDFDRLKTREGTLFLDGVNRLVPEDDCLIIYGHNMRNGTMFGRLDEFEKLSTLKANAVVHFDTLYANHLYVPFAAFTASMDKTSSRYFEVRRFLMTPEEFTGFISELKQRSKFDIPVDAVQGDSILLLVTCDYTNTDGRFILALRRLRDGETEADAKAMVAKAK